MVYLDAPKTESLAVHFIFGGDSCRRVDDMKMLVKVECYECEEPIEVPIDTLRSHGEYGKCNCGEGVHICYHAGVFDIERLPEEP